MIDNYQNNSLILKSDSKSKIIKMVENGHEKSNTNEKPRRRKAGEKNVWIYKTRGTR